MKTLKLTEEQITILKEALLCAEINREKEARFAGQKFAELHIDIDEQLKD